MKDKTTLGISDELRQYIETLVEEIVLEGKSFENNKKYLSRFSEAEGVDYESLETDLYDFFEIMEEWKSFHTKGSRIAAKMLGRACYLSEEMMNRLIRASEGGTDIASCLHTGIPETDSECTNQEETTFPWFYRTDKRNHSEYCYKDT